MFYSTFFLKKNNEMEIKNESFFSKNIYGIGEISIRPIQLDKDIEFLYTWVTKPYAKFWGMLDQSKDEVYKEYAALEKKQFYDVYIGMLNGKPIFLMEKYKASMDSIAKYYKVQENDYGVHVLVAPLEKRIPQLTWYIFTTIIDYSFSLPDVGRIVVEPDISNKKVHVLNTKAGFIYEKKIELPHKTAALAFCTKENYLKAKALYNNSKYSI